MNSIEFDKIDFSYKRGNKVFENFNLKLEPKNPGYVTTVMGASGSGKSTLLKLILGIEKIQAGDLIIKPKNPVISYVPQEPVLFEHLSLEKNARYFQFAGAYKDRFNITSYNELKHELGLSEVIERAKSVNEISGGQKQRISLLRALSINPDFILLDEPCNGLDAEVKRSFLNKLREIADRYGLYVLYITHHKLEAQLIADEVVYLIQNINGVVEDSVSAPIIDFISKPPTLEAAHVFRFPDVKILPIRKLESGEYEIADSNSFHTGFWLINNENISFSKSKGFNFKVVSKSPLYSIVKHQESDVELMVSSLELNGYEINSEVKLFLQGEHIEYDKNGLLINNKF